MLKDPERKNRIQKIEDAINNEKKQLNEDLDKFLNNKSKIKKIKSEDPIQSYIKFIFSLLFFGGLLYLIYWVDIIKKIKEPFLELFSNYVVDITILNILIPLMICYSLYLVIVFFLEILKFENKLFFTKVCIILLFFLWSGFSILFFLFGHQDLDYVLRDSFNTKNIIGDIKCNSPSNELLIGENISCDYNPKLYNYSSSITLILNNNTKVITNNSNEIKFTSLKDVVRIHFEIQGYDINNNYNKLEVGNDYTFYSKTEKNKRSNKLIQYLLAWLGLTLISIPSAMINFKNIWENKI